MTRRATSIVLVAAVLAARAASAEPHLAIREGLACSACHLNRTGGGMRNGFGAVYAATRMSLDLFAGAIADPNLGESVRIGADARIQSSTALWAKTFFPDGREVEAPTSNTFQIPEANLYLELRLIRDVLSLYVDELVSPETARSREAFVLIHGLPLGGYVKAGRFLLPFGLRLPDDAIFVREVSGFNYGNQDLGIEIGAEIGPLFIAAAGSNGTLGGADDNLHKQVTATAALVTRHARAGVSYSWTDATTESNSATRRVLGAFAALGAGRFSLLGEANLYRDRQGGPAGPELRTSWAFYAQADVRVVQGIDLRAGFDFHDPDVDVANDPRNRLTFAVDFIPMPFLKVSAAFSVRNDIPQRTQGNQDVITLQLHGFL